VVHGCPFAGGCGAGDRGWALVGCGAGECRRFWRAHGLVCGYFAEQNMAPNPFRTIVRCGL